MFESRLNSLALLNRGKVRDLYVIDDQHLLIVATDRISAFDVVIPTPIPHKGNILTEVSRFWFDFTRPLLPNHLADIALQDVLTTEECTRLGGRAVIVQRLQPLPIEAVVRGYLAGSGWKEYQEHGSVCGITLPDGLQQAERLPEIIFTPATKAAPGEHDENISFSQASHLIGAKLAEQVQEVSLELYRRARDYAAERGIIIADTKFEFAANANGDLILIDEVLTPDSSRFWPADQYRTGTSPPSFDKQFVRDYLETLDWDKKAPGPALPADIIEKTADKYREARYRLLNQSSTTMTDVGDRPGES